MQKCTVHTQIVAILHLNFITVITKSHSIVACNQYDVINRLNQHFLFDNIISHSIKLLHFRLIVTSSPVWIYGEILTIKRVNLQGLKTNSDIHVYKHTETLNRTF